MARMTGNIFIPEDSNGTIYDDDVIEPVILQDERPSLLNYENGSHAMVIVSSDDDLLSNDSDFSDRFQASVRNRRNDVPVTRFVPTYTKCNHRHIRIGTCKIIFTPSGRKNTIKRERVMKIKEYRRPAYVTINGKKKMAVIISKKRQAYMLSKVPTSVIMHQWQKKERYITTYLDKYKRKANGHNNATTTFCNCS